MNLTKAIDSGKMSLSMAERVGIGSFLIAISLLFFDVRLSVIALAGFILLCLAAPFFPRFGFYLPIISRGTSGKNAIALTFDDGPDPLSTPPLLQLLSKYQVKATFFVNGEKVAQHPELIKAILLHGHLIGNHSYTHNNLIFFKRCEAIVREIESTQNVLHDFGIRPLVFRPPVGITSPRLRSALLQSDMYIVNFSCRAFDGGNRWIKNISRNILNRIRPDDIVLLHDIRQKNERLTLYWLNEIELILMGLKDRSLAVLPLSDIIGKPVMIPAVNGLKVER
ncbi:MAG: polysaccharide deacetylase family protein [Desulfobacterales bacterium]